MKCILALILTLLSWPASAGQIDYFCIFANAVAAQADATVGSFWNGSAWDTSTTFPGVSVITPRALVNGISALTGFWIIVSRAADSPALDADTNCVMALDRDLGKVNGNFVMAAAIVGTNRSSLTFSPVPHGSGYPRPLGK